MLHGIAEAVTFIFPEMSAEWHSRGGNVRLPAAKSSHHRAMGDGRWHPTRSARAFAALFFAGFQDPGSRRWLAGSRRTSKVYQR